MFSFDCWFPSIMFKKIFSVLIISNLCNVINASAHYGLLTGCYSSATTYIYFSECGSYSGMRNFNWNEYSPQGERVLLANTFCPTSSLTSCRINGNGPGATNGKLYTFYYYECPVDDYIPLLFLGISAIGFTMLRKKTVNRIFYS